MINNCQIVKTAFSTKSLVKLIIDQHHPKSISSFVPHNDFIQLDFFLCIFQSLKATSFSYTLMCLSFDVILQNYCNIYISILFLLFSLSFPYHLTDISQFALVLCVKSFALLVQVLFVWSARYSKCNAQLDFLLSKITLCSWFSSTLFF